MRHQRTVTKVEIKHWSQARVNAGKVPTSDWLLLNARLRNELIFRTFRAMQLFFARTWINEIVYPDISPSAFGKFVKVNLEISLSSCQRKNYLVEKSEKIKANYHDSALLSSNVSFDTCDLTITNGKGFFFIFSVVTTLITKVMKLLSIRSYFHSVKGHINTRQHLYLN